MNRAREMRAPLCSEEILEAQPAAVAGVFRRRRCSGGIQSEDA